MIKRKNPTDHDLISKLEVKKDFPPYGVKYEVYLGKRRIAFADIDHGSTEISFVQVSEGYKLRGVATFLYDYIEEDLGRKLKPSEAFIEDGEAFWKARLKRSNPKNKKLLNELKIERKLKHRQPPVLNEVYAYNIYHNNKQIGYVWVNKTNSLINKVEILDSDYMRQGIATYLYDYIEKDLDIKLRPSNNLSSDGAEFWKNRLIKNPSSKSKPKNARTLITSKTKTPR